MKLIPVIDYKHGQVVLAKLGNRSEYKPVNTKLCPSSNIYDVIESILTLASFKTIYIADLDCIENQQLDATLWSTLCSAYPHIEFWIDLGSMCKQWSTFMHDIHNSRPVVGTESFQTLHQIESTFNQLSDQNPLLSIDIKNETILGPENLITKFHTWAYDVIILSISDVGSGSGPNKKAISQIQSLTTNTQLFYGGGIRNSKDLQQLENLGIKGVLIASTLHSGNLSKQEIDKFTS